MIQPQELRIGNLLYKFGIDYNNDFPIIDRNDREIITVDLEVLENIENFNGTTGFMYFEEISLTEEILLKFRYKKIRDNEFLFDNHFIIFIKESEIDFYLYNSEGNDFFVREIQFAHELQNLHYSIRKEELKFEDIS